MIKIERARTIEGECIDLEIKSDIERVIKAKGLTLFPGLIDPHVHFRTPGLEYKENWETAAYAAIAGGYTTVFDMPNTLPPTITFNNLIEKKALIDKQLQKVGIPLHYQLFFGADKNHLHEIPLVKSHSIGIKVFMGCSTGNLVIDDDESLEAVFELAAKENMLVAVHAEDEMLLRERKRQFSHVTRYSAHSEIRNIEMATRAVEKAINLTRKYRTRLYILHVSSENEIFLIKQAKKEQYPVFAEITPHHLFLDDNAYSTLQGKAVVNPPLRDPGQKEFLWQAIHEGILDTIGSDHAPHTLSEKMQPYPACPSGMPGIETTLPLLLNAYHQGFITLPQILALTETRAREIFQLPKNDDIVLVDLNKKKRVEATALKTRCAWSAFEDLELQGWPRFTIIQGQCFEIK